MVCFPPDQVTPRQLPACECFADHWPSSLPPRRSRRLAWRRVGAVGRELAAAARRPNLPGQGRAPPHVARFARVPLPTTILVTAAQRGIARQRPQRTTRWRSAAVSSRQSCTWRRFGASKTVTVSCGRIGTARTSSLRPIRTRINSSSRRSIADRPASPRGCGRSNSSRSGEIDGALSGSVIFCF